MLREKNSSQKRNTKLQILKSDFVVVGGGLAGVCAAITAGRSGLKVTLIQDRPVLGAMLLPKFDFGVWVLHLIWATTIDGAVKADSSMKFYLKIFIEIKRATH